MIEKITNQNQIARHKLAEKINELIDAANEYEKDREEIKEWIGIVSDLRSRVPVVESRVAILEEHAHPTAKTYAEQRKWIGKACWFWDNGAKDKAFGRLIQVDTEYNDAPFQTNFGQWFENCEPVKPDDDVIYQELTPEYLRNLMATPKYWKEQDPETVRKVEEGFRKLYYDKEE